MHPQAKIVEIDITDMNSADLQELGEILHDSYDLAVKAVMKELQVDEACASDVWYLRGRSRWTPEKEAELIRLHKAGTPPNVMEYGH